MAYEGELIRVVRSRIMCCVLVRLKLCINLALNLFETEHLRNGQHLKVTETTTHAAKDRALLLSNARYLSTYGITSHIGVNFSDAPHSHAGSEGCIVLIVLILMY